MKKLFIFTLLISSLIYPQKNSTKNILNLKQESRNLLKIDKGYSTEFQEEFHKKKLGLAIMYSLLLPGMGEFYAGNYSSGKYFTIADALLWGSYIGFHTYGNMRKSDYKSFAASYGGVNNSGKNDTYYSTIGNYINIQEYNDRQALERNFDKIYDVNQYYWDWKTNAQGSNHNGHGFLTQSKYGK